jgi:uncharacterized protein (TIGR02421 family)
MQKLSEAEIIQNIQAGNAFECLAEDESFILKIEAYAPVICTAIHAGHRMRDNISQQCLLSPEARRFEEDPFTEQFIQSMPITLIGNDSRYEYDLNRPIATCIYQKAWGKTVWEKPLSNKERTLSTDKHRRFYRILDALVTETEKRFGAALIFDIHSYNHNRHSVDTPTFNLGIEQIDTHRWDATLKRTIKNLTKVRLTNTRIWAACNEIFYGRGYLIAHTNSRFENTLALPLEIKKVFMDEQSGEPYPLLLNKLCQELKHCFTDTAAFFARKHTHKHRAVKMDMLSSHHDPAIKAVDQSLYRLARGLETLQYINPLNIKQEKKKFLASHGKHRPEFRYRPLDIDPYIFREKLYRLPVDDIRDVGIQQMYRQVIDELSSKIDLLVNAGKPNFIYNSLTYYGEPSLADERNAKFLLHAPQFEQPPEPYITAAILVEKFKQQADTWGMQCKIESSTRLVAAAMVLNSKKTVYINKDVLLDDTQAQALIQHELGVHMATTLNAANQPLKVFSLGLPGNTMTQEGLAILNEFQSGNMSLQRLKNLALRVLAVREMLNYGDFNHTYTYLVDEHHASSDAAFRLAVRVHRGGGFTKDYLYLKGVSEILRLLSQYDISSLYIGKTGFEYLSIINEMIARKLLKPPQFIPDYLKNPKPESDILNYLMSSIHPIELYRTDKSA